MRLEKISFMGFRNLEDSSIVPAPDINVIWEITLREKPIFWRRFGSLPEVIPSGEIKTPNCLL